MRALILATGLMLFGTAALAQPVVQERLKAIQADPASVKIAVDAGRKASFSVPIVTVKMASARPRMCRIWQARIPLIFLNKCASLLAVSARIPSCRA